MGKFIAGFGKTNVDLIFQDMSRLPNLGEEIFTEKFSLCLGGGIPATLLNLGRLGCTVKTATEFSTDMFSVFAQNEFIKAGVKPINLYEGNEIPVNLTCVILTEGERTFVSYGKATIKNSDERLYNELKGASIVPIQTENYEVYEKLHQEGSVLVLDTGYLEDLSIEKYKKYLVLADYYTPNRTEALKITGQTDVFEASKILKEYFQIVIIKLDKDGCLIYDGEKYIFVKSIEEYKNKDSTGAGDAFLAGFIYGLYNELPIEKCVLSGNLTGGKCVTGIGCTTEYLTEEELKIKLAQYENNIIFDYIPKKLQYSL